MQLRVEKAYVFFGVLFLMLGIATLLNVVAALQVGQTLLLQATGYGLMNLLVAYAFFKREAWLTHAFALNLVANALLIVISYANHERGVELLGLPIFSLIMMGSILWFIYYTRQTLRRSPWSIQAGALFAVLWVSTFIPNALSALP